MNGLDDFMCHFGVLIYFNGSEIKPISTKQNLHQEDPFSTFHFIFLIPVLSSIFLN